MTSRCAWCGIGGDHPAVRHLRCCPVCADDHGGRPGPHDLDRALARLLDLPAWLPGMADALGFTWAMTAGRRTDDTAARFAYADLDALATRARDVLPASAWPPRPGWAEPEEVAPGGRR